MRPLPTDPDSGLPRGSQQTGLRRGVSLPAAAALVVGGVVGVGIFLTPAGMARSLASPGLLFLVWAFLGATALCGALCFGELAARFPEAGGIYVYLREEFGPVVAFLYGWKCLLVMDPGLTAALATGLGAYAEAMHPGLSPKAVAFIAILAVTAANWAGIRLAAGIGHGLALIKVALLLLLVAWGFLSGAGDTARFFPFVARHPGAPPLLPALAGAVVSAFFSFGGWWEVSKLAGEIREPRRNLPRALAIGVAAVTFLYNRGERRLPVPCASDGGLVERGLCSPGGGRPSSAARVGRCWQASSPSPSSAASSPS